jgi:hypothetical protein
MSISQLIDDVYHSTGGYYLSRTIGKERRLGDVGTYSSGEGFRRLRTLDSFGVSYETRADEEPVSYEYKSSDGVDITLTGEGEAAEVFESLGEAEAGVRIQFSSEDAGVVSATGCVEPEIEDKVAVVSAIRSQRTESSDRNYAVVTGVVKADSATLLASGSSTAAIELRASGTFDPGQFELADLSTGFELSSSSDMRISQVAASGSTPMFQLRTVEEDTDWDLVPLPFSFDSQGRTPGATELPSRVAAGSEPTLDESAAEEMLRPVRPDELVERR